MKRAALIVLKLILLAAILIAIALVVRDARDTMPPDRYVADASAAFKFKEAARFLPADADLWIAIDLAALSQHVSLRDHLIALAGDQGGMVGDLSALLLQPAGSMGMAVVVGRMGEEGSPPAFALILQGRFDEASLLPTVRGMLASQADGMEERPCGERALFVERDTEAPFGFMLLDATHLIVGEARTIEAFFGAGGKPAASASLDGVQPQGIIFGALTLGPRLRALLPSIFADIPSVTFASIDLKQLVATLPCTNADEAARLTLFLEGMRSLILLQQQGNQALAAVLDHCAISSEANAAHITCTLPFSAVQ